LAAAQENPPLTKTGSSGDTTTEPESSPVSSCDAEDSTCEK